MASTSTNKKGIADFLWDWAMTNGDWAKALIDKIVTTEMPLTVADRQIVFEYFLQLVKLKSGLPPLQITKPTYTPTGKEIKLRSLSQITGVNRLAKNQTVSFGPNITVIYGQNGSGKTGYTRILKSLGFSYDTTSDILSNVYAALESKKAVIDFEVDGTQKSFTWTGSPGDPDLQNISVFNSHCVQISLADRHLIVAPIGFHLFNLVSGELQELQNLFDQKRATYPVDLPWSVSLSPGTPQQIFIGNLNAKSPDAMLISLSTFAAPHQGELDAATQRLSNLNKTLLLSEISILNTKCAELDGLIRQIKNSAGILSKANWDLFKDYIEQIGELEKKAQCGLAALAQSRGIEFYTSDEFKSFINAAEKYILLLNKPEYPTAGDVCTYCRQPLDDASRQLLADYRKLLNDKTQENLDDQKKRKIKATSIFAPADGKLILHQASFGLNAENEPFQPPEILEYNSFIVSHKETFLNDSILKTEWLEFDYSKYLDFLNSVKTKLDDEVAQKQTTLANLAQQESELKKKIAELSDRKLLSSKISDIKAVLNNLRIIQIFKDNSGVFNTGPISRKTTEAREELVKQNFDSTFQQELQAMRKSDIPIEMQFGTDRGHSKVTQRIKSHVPADILSEGEQKAIALAEFLTELQLDNIKAPVIFDDPVNSLDHRIIEEVTRRLIRLSETRQVIIFTHSILLMHDFIQQQELATNKHIDFKIHEVKRNFEETGCLYAFEEPNSFKFYLKRLNELLSSPKAGRDEDQMAAEGYGHLRAAIEVCVEEDILQKVLKRYGRGVAFPSLLRIDGTKIDTYKGPLNVIYEKCCTSINAHSSPSAIHRSPTISELTADLDAFKKIRSGFNA